MFGKTESTCSTASCLTSTLLVISILLNSVCLYLLMGNSFSLPSSISVEPAGIKKAILELEYEKVGGKTNYELISKATQLQMKDQIPQIEQYLKTQGGNTTAPTQQAVQPANTTMTQEEVAKILASASLEGNKSADIVAIEYSDMECPFCIKQYADTKLQPSLLTQYGDKVAFAFKNNRGVNHPGTEAKALSALCAKTLGGDAAYIGFYHAIMDGTSQGNVYPVAKLTDIAKNLKLDTKKWQTCIDTKATLAQFDAETNEAKKYNMSGTPGTLLLNVKTGKYATVEGAYPISEFAQKIASIQ
jgi:protein-disulfide isomerase